MNEQKAWRINGFLGVLIIATLIVIGGYLILLGQFLLGGFLSLVGMLFTSGIVIVQPNQAKVVTFFGRYVGSIRDSGIFVTVPFSARQNVSFRVRNFNSQQLKVNDVQGNPIEIAAVIVFKVVDSAKAVFDVDDYEQFVETQSETAIRHVATKYPYDTFENDDLTLRGNAGEVSDELQQELQARLQVAGVEVIEARLTHLAYSTEIASAMLQRQQAAAIIAARQKIVEGAVSMAQMAIDQLQQNEVVDLDEERKVNMINNLMVSIVSDRSSQPVINTGSLY